MKSKENCETCKWHDDFTWICCNGYSQYVAEVTDKEKCCEDYEELEEDNLNED